MLDEWAERVVDDLCERIPAYVRPRLIALSVSPLGWRLNLYAGTAVRAVASLADRLHTDEGFERFWEEKLERAGRVPYALVRMERAFARMGDGFFRLCREGRFGTTFFLLALAAVGLAATGGGQIAACAASLALLWLSVAMEQAYPPVSGAVRQRYLAAALLRGGSMLPLLMRFFMDYARWGVPNNIVLQSAMAVMLCVHLSFFLPLIAFNRRQPLLLRALSGVLGVIPALTVAAAIAAVFSAMGETPMDGAGAAVAAVGALTAFAGEQTASLVTLGGIRLKRQEVWMYGFTTAGYALLLAGAWLRAAA